jgi:tripartite motif-containing protein 2/3/tripartite motif-containing protein 71
MSENPSAISGDTVLTDVDLVSQCLSHEGKKLELYCSTCGELICLRCALKGGKHHEHDYEELEKAFKKCKAEVTCLLEPMEEQVKDTKTALAEINAHCGEISSQRAATAINIRATFTQLREVLDVRESELTDQLDMAAQRKLKGLVAQRDQIETTLAQQCSCLDYMRECLTKGNKGDVPMMINMVVQANELTTTHQFKEPNTKSAINFLAPTDAIPKCRNYGLITERNPSNYKLDSNLEVVDAGVAVKLSGENLDTPIQTISGVVGPWGVAFNQIGEMVVTEQRGCHVSVFSPSGEKLRSFGAFGSGPGQFQYPHEVAVDSEGNILIVDSGNHCIQRFTSEGKYKNSVGTEGSKHLQFSYPSGIIFNATNSKVYVSDTRNNRVQVLNSNLTFNRTIGEYGSGRGQFNYPSSIACDSVGKVYVADQNNHRIQVFTAGGWFLRMFGRRGCGGGELDYPVGVAIGAKGKVYVSEGDNHRVSVFDSEGEFMQSFGWKGKPGEFVHPRGLAVDNSGVVYVCDKDNVKVFLLSHPSQLFCSPGNYAVWV